ncbi:unnamed protein product [Thelazia callipaeda]|uniref:SERPIN domain-containing protein n=1 Tax=Thelazia callipaeda TaxID=103827 RepID=A0A0N5CPJ7_THECL|nr:unnamed protein product [Thelazia callipaeda]
MLLSIITVLLSSVLLRHCLQNDRDMTKIQLDLALDIYRDRFPDSVEPAFFSPFAITSALSTFYERTTGDSENQLNNLLAKGESKEKLLHYVRMANRRFEENADKVEIGIGSQHLMNDYLAFEENTDGRTHDNDVRNTISIDYSSDQQLDEIRKHIGEWIKNRTEHRTRNVIFFNDSSLLFSVFEIHCGLKWLYKFKLLRMKSVFRISDKKVEKVRMMKTVAKKLAYAETEEAKIIALPFESEKKFMLIIIPRKGNLSNLESKLTGNKLHQYIKTLSITNAIEVTMPMFEIRNVIELGPYLKDRNIALCDQNSDYYDNDNEQLCLQNPVRAVAHIKVNEHGIYNPEWPMTPNKDENVNASRNSRKIVIEQSFIFAIGDFRPTIYFMGRYTGKDISLPITYNKADN